MKTKTKLRFQKLAIAGTTLLAGFGATKCAYNCTDTSSGSLCVILSNLGEAVANILTLLQAPLVILIAVLGIVGAVIFLIKNVLKKAH